MRESITMVRVALWNFRNNLYQEMDSKLKLVLVVDLDGTLLNSDILHETFYNSFGKDWRSPFLSVAALMRGKAALKRHLANTSTVDVSTLPFDSAIISYVEAWREGGGRTALVTASDERIAQQVSQHLNLFDEVYGSDGVHNLKGPAKAKFLAERYADTGFAYMGDAEADLPVWKLAKRVITVSASTALRCKAEALGTEVEHLQKATASIWCYTKAIRPHQWLKNILVFLPVLAAQQYDEVTLLRALLAFVAFSMIASSVYVLNDLLDLAADRAHPRKCKRPFASGNILIAHGTWMAGGLVLFGAVLAAFLGWEFFTVMAGYYIITTAYSLYLKSQIVIDICVLAGLYTMRIIAGGVATDIPLSVWLLAFSIFFFFSLAAVKRLAELKDIADRGILTATGRGYHVDDLPLVSQIAIGAGYVSVLLMTLYVNSPTVVELYSYPPALWGICLVLLYWITRIVMVAHRGCMHDDPVVYAAKDRISQVCFLLIIGCALGGSLL